MHVYCNIECFSKTLFSCVLFLTLMKQPGKSSGRSWNSAGEKQSHCAELSLCTRVGVNVVWIGPVAAACGGTVLAEKGTKSVASQGSSSKLPDPHHLPRVTVQE